MSRRYGVAIVAAVAAIALASCGGDDPAGETEATEGALTKVTLGAISVAGDAPAVLAADNGIFEKHGLDVTIQPGQNFGAILPLVQNGELQIGFSSAIPLLNASSRGADIRVFATQEYTGDNPDTATIAVMVPEDSPLESARDLEGKKVGVVAQGNSDSLALLAAVDKDGGDPDLVELLELGIGSPLLQALEIGNVDAIVGGEPTMSTATAAGNRVLLYPLIEGIPNLPQAGYFTTDRFAEENADTLRSFAAAIVEASKYANENPDEMRELLPGFLNIEPEIAQAVRLPEWETTFAPDDWAALAEVGIEYGVLPPGTTADAVQEP